MLTAQDGARGMNFLTPEIHEVARERLQEGQGTVEEFRLLHNLLSSQPMCFNLFGPLVRDHALATLLWRALLGDEVAAVTRVRLEYAPLPAAEYLDDRTAFDAFVEYRRPDGALCFTGVETKLTEPFSQSGDYSQAQRRYQRWLERAELPWRPDRLSEVDAKEHNQLWRDHLLAFAIDRYNGKIQPHPPFKDFLLFMSFFPHLVAGPILRYADVSAAIKNLPRFRIDGNVLAPAFGHIAAGLAAKILLADTLAKYIAQVTAEVGEVGFAGGMLVLGGYSFRIYFDFYGYSLVAIGLGLLFGFSFPKNFADPYKAPGIREFWRRWHMTLSFWIRDYLYLPLGGNAR